MSLGAKLQGLAPIARPPAPAKNRPMRFAALVAAICSVLVGCGGHARPTRAGDSRVAKASVITLHDFPPGWSGDDQHLRNSVACDAIQAAMKAANAVQTTDVFSHGGDAQAEFAVYVFPDPARAQRAFRAIAARSMRLCLGARLATAVRDAKTVTHVDHPKTGPETVPAVGDRQGRAAARAADLDRGRPPLARAQ